MHRSSIFYPVLLLIWGGISLFRLPAQNLDSLWQIWHDSSQADSVRLESLVPIIQTYISTNPDSALLVLEQQVELATAVNNEKWIAYALKVQGVVYSRIADYPTALVLFKKSLSLNQKIGRNVEIGACMVNMGNIYLVTDHPDSAFHLFSQAKEIFEETEEQLYLGIVLGNLGNISQLNGNYQEAEEYFQQSLSLARETKNKRAIGRNLMRLGLLYTERDMGEEPLDYMEPALELAKEMGDIKAQASAFQSIGSAYQELGDSRRAIQHLMEGLQLAEQYGDKENQAWALIKISEIYKFQEEYDKGIEYGNQALSLANQLGVKIIIAEALNRIANIYEYKEEYLTAINLYLKCKKIYEEYGAETSVGAIMINIGICYLDSGQIDQAETYYRDGLHLSETGGNIANMINALLGLSSISFEREEYANALAFNQQAKALAEVQNDAIAKRDVAWNAYKISKATGKPSHALAMYERFQMLKDSIHNSETQRNLLRREYAYEYDKQALADSLNYVQQKADTEIGYQKQLANRNYLLFGGLGLALVGFLFFRYRTQLRSRQREIELQQERERKEQLAELDQMKSRFFANISHEFRTPLTLILGQNQSLQAEIDDPKVDAKFDMVNRNGKRLLQLVNQVLDLAKLEAGKLDWTPQTIELISFLKNQLFSFESLADQKHIQLSFEGNLDELLIVADAEKLERVFYNLLSNAIKFTPEGGEIKLTVTKENQRVHIAVADNGIGINQEQLPYIFDRFYQAEGGDTHPSPGTGIGLALAKELVEMHNGNLMANSQLGAGSTFQVVLPITVGALQPEVDYQPKLEPIARPIEITEVFPHSSHPESNRILIVEDNPDVRSYLKNTLHGFGYDVIEAADGVAGLKQAQSNSIDLIISDVMMPRMDGFSFAKAIREDARISHIPLILLTAKASDDSLITGLATGVDAYLTKPFNTKELEIRIAKLIEQRKRLKQQFSTSLTIKPEEVSAVPMDQLFLKTITDTIEAHIGDSQLGVDMLSEVSNMSIQHLNRKLNALIGQSAGKFIRSMRLQRAADLIQKRAGTISDIAYDMGFSSPTNFARAFKKQFGVSPSEYLQQKG